MKLSWLWTTGYTVPSSSIGAKVMRMEHQGCEDLRNNPRKANVRHTRSCCQYLMALSFQPQDGVHWSCVGRGGECGQRTSVVSDEPHVLKRKLIHQLKHCLYLCLLQASLATWTLPGNQNFTHFSSTNILLSMRPIPLSSSSQCWAGRY